MDLNPFNQWTGYGGYTGDSYNNPYGGYTGGDSYNNSYGGYTGGDSYYNSYGSYTGGDSYNNSYGSYTGGDSYYNSYSGYNGGDFYSPVVLDLAGKGIRVTPLSSSNTFMDMANSGRQQCTAWAGAGNGVLVYDPTGGPVTQANQFEFTLWDPSAATDMEALRDVFDNNHDGILNSADSSWASFRVLVTNADGTTTLQTLAQAGVASINLDADTYRQALPDGSAISGETTFTRADGTTGTAASARFAAAGGDYGVQQTVSRAADGSTTIANAAYGPDGSLAQRILSTTSADGRSRTVSTDWNGDGVVDQTQSDVTVVNADGSSTETLRDTNGAGILLDRTTTMTAANGKTVTISRDTTGAGFTDQQEVDVTGPDGSRSITVSALSRNGSLIGRSSSVVSASGQTRTVATDPTGSGYADTIETDQAVVAANGLRTQTVTVDNADGSLRRRTVTARAANGLSTVTQTDSVGSGVFDRTETATTVVNADASRTTTTVEQATNGAVLGRTVATVSANGNATTTQFDRVGNGSISGTQVDVITFDGAGNRTETVGALAGDGSTVSRQVSVRNTDGRSGSTLTYANMGYGLALSESATRAVNAAGALVETRVRFASNGQALGRTVTTTNADGLGQTVQQDLDGGGVVDVTTTTSTVRNAVGGAVTTTTRSASDGTRIGQTMTTTSADGNSVVTKADGTGSGTYDTTVYDIRTQNADGSVTEVVTTSSAKGTLLGRRTTVTSANRATVTITTANGDGETVRVETSVLGDNGTLTRTVADYAPDHSLVDKSITVSSANGLSITTAIDTDGTANGAANGIDRTVADTTVVNANGSRTRTVSSTSVNGTLIDRTVTTTSANGLATVTTTAVDGKVDYTTTDSTIVNTDGSRTETARRTAANGALVRSTATRTSGNGLSVTTATDVDGDGTVDRTRTDATALNVDGSTTETVSDVQGTGGALIDRVVTTVSASGAARTISRDSAGRGFFDHVETVASAADGGVVDTVKEFGASGHLLGGTTTTVSGNGLVTTRAADRDGDGTADSVQTAATVYGADGSKTVTTTTKRGTSVVSTSIVTTSANGLASTATDYGSAGTVQGADGDVRILNEDGSVAEIVSRYAGNGTLIRRTTTTTSADGKVTNSWTSSDGGPVHTQDTTSIEQADGSVVVTSNAYAADGKLSVRRVRTTAANGLNWTQTADDNADGTIDDTQSSTAVLNADGGRTDTFKDVRADGAAGTTVVTTSSANGLVKTVATTGTVRSIADSNTLTDTTVINDDGSTTQTRTIVLSGGAGAAWSREVVQTSANGQSTTTRLSEGSDSVTDYADQVVVNADGSRVETVTVLQRNGAAFQTDVRTTSADGLSMSLQSARNGSATNNHFETATVNPDGGTVRTAWDTDGSGTTTSEVVVATSGNGLSRRTQVLATGTAAVVTTTQETTLNADGGTTEVTSRLGPSGALQWRQTRAAGADGLAETTALDVNGDGTVDETTSTVRTVNADGSQGLTETTTYANGTRKSQKVTTTSADGLVVSTQSVIDGFESVSDVSTTATSGGTSEVLTHSTPAGKIASTVTTTVSADRAIRVVTSKDANGAVTQVATATIQAAANGSYNWLLQNGSNKTLAQATHLVDANGVDHVSLSIGTKSYNSILTLDQEAQTTAEVTRLYGTLLGRAPSASDTELALQHYTASGFDLGALTSSILALTEFTTKYGTLTNLEFVELVYQNALGRGASLDELAGWLAQLAAGKATRATIAATVSGSAEHVLRGNILPETNNTYSPDGTWSLGHTIDSAQATAIVQRLYLATLGRVADSGGLTYYANNITTGTQTAASIASAFVGSGEFGGRYGSLTTPAFVATVFVNALGRLPSLVEQGYWESALNAGTVSKADFCLAMAVGPDGGSVAGTGTGQAIDSAQATAIVQRLYLSILGRVADSGGLTYYAGNILNGFETAAGVASAFLRSGEFGERYGTLTTSSFVTTMFANALGRAPSPSEQAYWESALNAGAVSKADLCTMLAVGPDGGPVAGTGTGQAIDSAEVTAIVQRLYLSILGRGADSGGLAYYAGNILNGVQTAAGVASAFLGSGEFTTKYGTLTDLEFVERIYRNALGRGASLEELTGWLAQVARSTATRAKIAIMVSESAEHIQQAATLHTTDGGQATAIVQRLYVSILGRAADSGGLAYYANNVLNGQTAASVAATFLASGEFAGRYGALTTSAFVTAMFANALGRAPSPSEQAYWESVLNAGTVSKADFCMAVAADPGGDSVVGNGTPHAIDAPFVVLANDTSGGLAVTSNGLVNVSGLKVGARWQYSLDSGQTWVAGSGATIAAAALGGDGAKTVQVRQVDIAGNTSAATSLAFRLDTQAAALSLALAQDTSAGRGITRNAQVNLGGFESGAGWQYSLDGGQSWAVGAGTAIAASAFGGDGAKTVQVRQIDAAGNISAISSVSFTLATAAVVPILTLVQDTSDGRNVTSNGQVNISALAAGGTWQYSLNGGLTWTAGSGTSLTSAMLGVDGAKTVQVRQTDAAGNVSAVASLAFALDTVVAAPTLVLVSDTGVSTTDRITVNGQVTVGGLEAGATWLYSLDNGAHWIAGGGNTIAASVFGANGAKTVQVRQADIAGNVSASTSLAFTVETRAAQAAAIVQRLYLAALGRVADSGGLNYYANNIINGVQTASGVASTLLGSSEFDGRYGSLSPSAFVTTAFVNALGRGPSLSEQAYWQSVLNAGAVSKADFCMAVAVDSQGGSVVVSGTTRAIDAPLIALANDTSGGLAMTSNGLVNVSGLNVGAHWQYSLNCGRDWMAGSDAAIAASSFGADGAKSVQVRQVDAPGNTSPVATLSFMLDTAAPVAPSAKLVLADAVASVAASGLEANATFQYQADGGTWTTATGTGFALGAGTHSWSIRQVDVAGNVSGTAAIGRFVVGTSALGQSLSGAAGGDTFVIGRGTGNDTINASAGRGSDILALGPTIAHDQLWFSRSGSNLLVSVLGQSETITVADWYSSANSKLSKIVASDGYAIGADGVQAMVQAMASFAPPPAAQTTLSGAAAAALAPAMAASWHNS